jgi:cytochrome c553
MVVFGAVAYGAKKFFTANSFYEYGHYRGDSVAEIAADKPKFQGVAYCARCHVQELTQWASGIHNSTDVGKIVRCEICHGPAGARDVRGPFQHVATGPQHPENIKLAVPTDSRKLCTLCHERMTGRPLAQRQIVVAEHAGTQQCTVCHNPHSPLLNLAPAAPIGAPGDAAAAESKAAECAGCHGAGGVSAGLPGPSLAGQNEAYLVGALKAYANGARTNPMMSAAAGGLSEQDTGNLATYYAGQKCDSTLTADQQAESATRAAAATCAACHGANGRSSNRAWPNLVGMSKDYLVSALKAYKEGARKNPMMEGIAKTLSDAEIDNAAAFYSTASCKS